FLASSPLAAAVERLTQIVRAPQDEQARQFALRLLVHLAADTGSVKVPDVDRIDLSREWVGSPHLCVLQSQGLSSLVDLDLRHTWVGNGPRGSWDQLTSLQKLDLSGTQVRVPDIMRLRK